MKTWGARTSAAVCGAVLLATLAGACSGGGGHSSASGSTTTSSAGSASSSTGSSVSSSTTKAKGTSGAKSQTTTTFEALTVPTVGQLGVPTTPPTSASTSPPTTAKPTPTTFPGPKPYDPSKPIDLGGEPGVTPAEQARAEELVRDTLRDLPKYADWHIAFNAGYRSIGDAVTGDEHFVNWAYVSDNYILNSKYPESLVYEMRNGKKTLVAAMYTLKPGDSFADVPDVGGALTQWHVHNDLCLADDPSDPLRKYVVLPISGACPPGSTKAGSMPMLHVWIVANPCGPFAALSGISGGQIPPGETRLCDTGHGSG